MLCQLSYCPPEARHPMLANAVRRYEGAPKQR
jgi:hypothetical protein